MVGSYSCVHWPRTRRSVMEDLPGGWEGGSVSGVWLQEGESGS